MMVVAEYANVRFLYFPVFQMFGENTNPVRYRKITEVASDWKKVYHQYDFRPDEYDNVIFDDLSPDYSLNNECLLSAME